MAILPSRQGVEEFLLRRAVNTYATAGFALGYVSHGLGKYLVKNGPMQSIDATGDFWSDKLPAVVGNDPLLGLAMGGSAATGVKSGNILYTLAWLALAHVDNIAKLGEQGCTLRNCIGEAVPTAALIVGAYTLGHGINKGVNTLRKKHNQPTLESKVQ